MILFKNFEIILLSNNEDQTCHKPCLSKQKQTIYNHLINLKT